MSVPLIDSPQQHRPLLPQLREAFERLVASGGFILGPEVERFEAALAPVTGSQFALGLSSGTDALLIAMMALDIGPGDEVIVPPFTFFATAGCVARLGAKPVFVDVLPDSFNIDPARIEAAITPRTKAIIPVHLFGLPAEMTPILDIARRHQIHIIEDAAQAIGATDHGKAVGSFGEIACLSFYPTKNLSAMGDAGAVTTSDPALAKRLKSLRLHGSTVTYHHDEVGGNFRIDAFQASVLNIKLPHLPAYNTARRKNAHHYNAVLAGLPLVLPTEGKGKHHVYHQYTIRVPGGKRDALHTHLAERKIAHGIYYPIPLHLQKCFTSLGHKPGDFPVSELLASEVISLPIFPELTNAQLDEVTDAIKAFFR